MALTELLRIVTPPVAGCQKAPNEGTATGRGNLPSCPLPSDYLDLCEAYGNGYFDAPGHLMLFFLNPMSPEYEGEFAQACADLRFILRIGSNEADVPYGVYPGNPGWLPWGHDIDGNLLCWITEGKPDEWPTVLLSADHRSFQQVNLPVTTFLARVFTRQITTILWNDSEAFTIPVRFVPETRGVESSRCDGRLAYQGKSPTRESG